MEMLNKAIEDADAFSKMMEKCVTPRTVTKRSYGEAQVLGSQPANREERRARAHAMRKPGDAHRK